MWVIVGEYFDVSLWSGIDGLVLCADIDRLGIDCSMGDEVLI